MKLKNIEHQEQVFQNVIPGIGGIDRNYYSPIKAGRLDLPLEADGWACFPKAPKVATLNGIANISIEMRHAIMTNFAVMKMKERQNLYNECGHFGGDDLRKMDRTAECMRRIWMRQECGDILVVPIKFSKILRREKHSLPHLADNEFFLTIFSVLWISLANPNVFANTLVKESAILGDQFEGNKYFKLRFEFNKPKLTWLDIEETKKDMPYITGFVI